MTEVHEFAVAVDGMTVEMRLLREALQQRVRDLRLNLVVITIAGVALLCSLILTLVNYKISEEQNDRYDREAGLRNKRAVCVNTVNANWQGEFGKLITDDSPASRIADGKPVLTADEQRQALADFRHATDLTRRIPEICYGPSDPDETPLDR